MMPICHAQKLNQYNSKQAAVKVDTAATATSTSWLSFLSNAGKGNGSSGNVLAQSKLSNNAALKTTTTLSSSPLMKSNDASQKKASGSSNLSAALSKYGPQMQ